MSEDNPINNANNLDPNSENYVDDYERLRNDPELTTEMIKEELSRYEKALEEEMMVKAEAEPENIERHTSHFFKENAHFAAAQVVWLAMHAESETVRGNMSKYILDTAYKVEKENQDPIANIIEGLQKNDKKPQPANRDEENS